MGTDYLMKFKVDTSIDETSQCLAAYLRDAKTLPGQLKNSYNIDLF